MHVIRRCSMYEPQRRDRIPYTPRTMVLARTSSSKPTRRVGGASPARCWQVAPAHTLSQWSSPRKSNIVACLDPRHIHTSNAASNGSLPRLPCGRLDNLKKRHTFAVYHKHSRISEHAGPFSYSCGDFPNRETLNIVKQLPRRCANPLTWYEWPLCEHEVPAL